MEAIRNLHISEAAYNEYLRLCREPLTMKDLRASLKGHKPRPGYRNGRGSVCVSWVRYFVSVRPGHGRGAYVLVSCVPDVPVAKRFQV